MDQFLFAPAFIALIVATCAALHALLARLAQRVLTPPRAHRLTTAEGNAHLVQAKLRQGVRAPPARRAQHARVRTRPCLDLLASSVVRFCLCRPDWGNVVVANWKLWVPFQFINFRFVPPSLQVAAANVCAVVWNVILSLMSHAKVQEPAPVAAKGKPAPAKGKK